ncbi:uncharacterized protein LOC131218047 [Magnolia sinica]|uniref:uncharacterized protein LOC131218047 n=1 Tax=Magnolia sinica TaxID=86752 RepID=UPI0026580207|nr:uncharacterized protein LOC131218047 [Magnolia sinica]
MNEDDGKASPPSDLTEVNDHLLDTSSSESARSSPAVEAVKREPKDDFDDEGGGFSPKNVFHINALLFFFSNTDFTDTITVGDQPIRFPGLGRTSLRERATIKTLYAGKGILSEEAGAPSLILYPSRFRFRAYRVGEKEEMDKEEKRKKYHNALMNIFYPPQSPPRQHTTTQQQVAYGPVDFMCEGLYVDSVSEDDDLEKGSSSDDVSEGVPQKLTRAQRKRIRKKKLKEVASRRSKIIGPLLPTHEDLEGEPSNLQNELVHKTVHDTVQASDACCNSPEALEHTHPKTN